MTSSLFHGRKAAQLENNELRVTVLEEGGHIAEVFDKRAGVSPLWIPHWESIEPSAFSDEHKAVFGDGVNARLLAGIMGHNLCLDLFGGPTEDEAALGLTAHGEASVERYGISGDHASLTQTLTLPMAQILFTREVRLHGENVQIRESVENLLSFDRPIAWTQHVTLGPPFLDAQSTEFRASMSRSVVSESDPGFNAYLKPAAKFDWPLAPNKDGGQSDLQRMHATAPASGYTAHLADAQREHAYFVAHSPHYKLAFGYVWKSADFPWLGIWEENCSRPSSPWNGRSLTRGMEFGMSPFPESRRAMVERGTALGAPAFKWLGARQRIEVEYWISSRSTDRVPESLEWPLP